MRSCSARSRAARPTPTCAPMTPPTSRISASITSTVPLWVACSTAVKPVTKRNWKTEVPTTTLVGMPIR